MRQLISISAIRKSVKIAVFLTAAVFLLGVSFVLFGSSTVTGKVISQDTRKPIEGAMVYVHSEMPYEENGFNSYVTTDVAGSFSANIRGNVSLIRVWKPGYAVRGIKAGNPTLLETVIKLRELSSTNLVTEHFEFYNFSHGGGFCFALGKSVRGDSSDADIVITQDVNDRTTGYIEIRGEGGIIFRPWDEQTDFYNSPQAPDAGYEKRLAIPGAQEGLYFIRTRDGKHYAKFRLLVDLAQPFKGSPFLDFEHSQLLWAYQADGTRNLDIRPSKNLSFPVEKFGLKRESLGQ
jgi:hypothetical protein